MEGRDRGNLRSPVIAISGLHGAGRSTHAKRLASYFGLRYVSAGQLFREFSTLRHMKVQELSAALMDNPELDAFIDRRTKEEGEKGGVVLDGDLSAWMAKDYADVKIFLTAPDEVRFERIAKRDGKTIEEVKLETMKREAHDRQRYNKFYGIDFLDLSLYDLILNTGSLSKEGVFRVLKVFVSEVLKERRRKGN
ncbi:AAA family ATPase [Candidatus Bathyarchaeota archaeon]|nr:AAA family ATPase [Candidatus Bathyarchaeota archaeon]MBS7628253.1 AAA family ATPase [Candidatus Bathyarchaeota archaeon]